MYYTLMVIHMSGVYDKNNVVINSYFHLWNKLGGED